METENNIVIKGIKEGLLISIKPGKWSDRKEEIVAIIRDRNSFFNGARVCIDVGEIQLRVTDITTLRDLLSDQGIILWAIFSQSEKTNNNAKALGFETKIPEKNDSKEHRPVENDVEQAVFINKTLRAGYRVESKNHVIIKGDVNPGAEIVSSGNIIVWGKLTGSAFAGADGNANSYVCALELRPTQLRIAAFVFPPFGKKGKSFPEMASIRNEEFKIDIWNKEKDK